MNRQNPQSQPPERGPGWPEGQDDVINKYGTYEVQRTSDTDNRYPLIAQGMPSSCRGTFRDSHPAEHHRKRRERGGRPLPPGEI